MKKSNYTLIIILFVSCASTYALNKDSIFVVNTCKYDVSKGISTENMSCINQKTFALRGKIISEVFYSKDPETENRNQIDKIDYYYYKNNQLETIETINGNGEIVNLRKFEYIENNKVKSEYIIERIDGNLIQVGSKSFKYGKDNSYQVVLKNKKRKKTAIILITENPKIKTEVTTYTKHSDQDSLLKKEKNTVYNNQRQITKTTEIHYSETAIDTITRIYTYQKSGLLEKIEKKHNNKEKTFIYQYYPNGMKRSERVRNEDGKTIGFIEFRTEEFFKDLQIPMSRFNNYTGKLK